MSGLLSKSFKGCSCQSQGQDMTFNFQSSLPLSEASSTEPGRTSWPARCLLLVDLHQEEDRHNVQWNSGGEIHWHVRWWVSWLSKLNLVLARASPNMTHRQILLVQGYNCWLVAKCFWLSMTHCDVVSGNYVIQGLLLGKWWLAAKIGNPKKNLENQSNLSC